MVLSLELTTKETPEVSPLITVVDGALVATTTVPEVVSAMVVPEAAAVLDGATEVLEVESEAAAVADVVVAEEEEEEEEATSVDDETGVAVVVSAGGGVLTWVVPTVTTEVTT